MTLIQRDRPGIDIGERLRVARETVGATQAAAAAAVGVARTTLVAIEQGQRPVRIGEIQKLAKLYGTSVNGLMRVEAIHVDLVSGFRQAGRVGRGVEEATRLLAALVAAEVELEELLGVRHPTNHPPERPILARGDVKSQAEQDAAEFRQWLGLGMRPVRDIVGLLELELGARVYIRPIDHGIMGLFAYDSAVGACFLLNAGHPGDRRATAAARALGHLVATRRKPEILFDDVDDNSLAGRHANAFARAFLTPARATMRKFQEITAGSPKLNRRHIILMGHYFGVSREAMVRRLEELGLSKPGTWDWFAANGGITNEQARQVLGDLYPGDGSMLDSRRPTTLRLAALASEVSRQGLLSEGQLSRLLHVDRIDLREMLDELADDDAESDDAGTLDL